MATFTWEDPTNTDCFEEYPNADLVYNFGNSYWYWQKTATEFIEVGYCWNEGMRIFIDNNYPQEGFAGFSLGDTIHLEYSYYDVTNQGADTTIYNRSKKRIYHGFGTVLTPIGQFDNCVMIKELRNNTVEYDIYKNSFSNRVATLIIYPPSVEPRYVIRYMTSEITEIVDSKESYIEPFNIYQTPDRSIFVESPKYFDANYAIYDTAGKLITVKNGNQFLEGNNEIKLQKTYPAGIYILVIENEQEQIYQSFKFLQP